MKKIIIEILGMPGSGKTYLKKYIFNNNKKKTYFLKNFNLIKNKFLKTLYSSIFFLNNPTFYIATLINILINIKVKSEKKRYLYFFFNETALRSYFLIRSKNEIYIDDEGFYYRSHKFLQNQSSLLKKKKYLDLVPKIDLIIYINSIKEINLKRANTRISSYRYNVKRLINYDLKKKNLLKILEISKGKKIKTFVLNESNKKQLIYLINRI